MSMAEVVVLAVDVKIDGSSRGMEWIIMAAFVAGFVAALFRRGR